MTIPSHSPDTPAVSVVLPTYNRAHTIRRAVDSALGQTYRDFEILVIDDGSADDTASLLRPYAERASIRYLTQPHTNAAAARNRGVRESRGAYIAFLDSDDEWLPDKLLKQVAVLEAADRGVGIVYCDMLRVAARGRVRSFAAPHVRRGETFRPGTYDYQFVGVGIQSTLFRRQCFTPSRQFDERLFALCDLELFLRMAETFEFYRLEEPLVRYYAGPGMSTNPKANANAREYMLAKYRDRFVERPRHLAYQYAKISAARFVDGDATSAREYARKALRLDSMNAGVLLRTLPGLLRLGGLLDVYRFLERIVAPR